MEPSSRPSWLETATKWMVSASSAATRSSIEAVLVRDRSIDEASLEVLGEAKPAQRRQLAVVQRPSREGDDADAAAVADPVQRIWPRRNDQLGKRRSAGRRDQSGGVTVGRDRPRGDRGSRADQVVRHGSTLALGSVTRPCVGERAGRHVPSERADAAAIHRPSRRRAARCRPRRALCRSVSEGPHRCPRPAVDRVAHPGATARSGGGGWPLAHEASGFSVRVQRQRTDRPREPPTMGRYRCSSQRACESSAVAARR